MPRRPQARISVFTPEMLILNRLVQLFDAGGKETYGQELSGQTGVPIGTIYGVLDRLEEKGLVVGRIDDRPRKQPASQGRKSPAGARRVLYRLAEAEYDAAVKIVEQDQAEVRKALQLDAARNLISADDITSAVSASAQITSNSSQITSNMDQASTTTSDATEVAAVTASARSRTGDEDLSETASAPDDLAGVGSGARGK